MKHIAIITLFVFGFIGTASAAINYIWVNDEDIFAKVRTENFNAEVYKMVDTDHNNVCYIVTYGSKVIPDISCVNVASSTVK